MLFIELVPSSSWGDNLRSHLERSEWDKLRRATYTKAKHLCEVCEGRGRRHPVECHEIWLYDDDAHIQKLSGLISLCPSCHEVKHYGLACVRGRQDQALAHLMVVNDWSYPQAAEHAAEAFRVWLSRSRHGWTLDLTWLLEQGIINVSSGTSPIGSSFIKTFADER